MSFGAVAAYRAVVLARNEESELAALFLLSEMSVAIWSKLRTSDPVRAQEWRAIATTALERVELLDAKLSPVRAPNNGSFEFKVADWRGATPNDPSLEIDIERSLKALELGYAPVYCIGFTDSVSPDRDRISDHVSISSEDRVVDDVEILIQENTICLNGLTWNTHYTLAFERGLPSATGNMLSASRVFSLPIPPKPPRVGFNTDHFILPFNSSGHVPIKSTSIRKAEIEIFRVSDREILRQVALGHYRNSVDLNELRSLRNTLFEPIWRGPVEIEANGNASVDIASKVKHWAQAQNSVDPAFRESAEKDGFVLDSSNIGGVQPKYSAYAVMITEAKPVADARHESDRSVIMLNEALRQTKDIKKKFR